MKWVVGEEGGNLEGRELKGKGVDGADRERIFAQNCRLQGYKDRYYKARVVTTDEK